jgi:hypothetical protein
MAKATSRRHRPTIFFLKDLFQNSNHLSDQYQASNMQAVNSIPASDIIDALQNIVSSKLVRTSRANWE